MNAASAGDSCLCQRYADAHHVHRHKSALASNRCRRRDAHGKLAKSNLEVSALGLGGPDDFDPAFTTYTQDTAVGRTDVPFEWSGNVKHRMRRVIEQEQSIEIYGANGLT